MLGLIVALSMLAIACSTTSSKAEDEWRPSVMDIPACDLAPDEIQRRGVLLEQARRRAVAWLEVYSLASVGFGPAPASYPDAPGVLGGRRYLYDAALALLWTTWMDDRGTSDMLAMTLQGLQRKDGAWPAYDPANARTRVESPAGVTGWVAWALAYYGDKFNMPEATASARRGADYLLERRYEDEVLLYGLVKPRDAPASYAVTEHQLDAERLFDALDDPYTQDFQFLIRDRFWLEDEGRFAVAVRDDGVDEARALDVAGGWGSLWLLAIGEQDEARRSLAYTLENFQIGETAEAGFVPYLDPIDGYEHRPSDPLVFYEGSIGVGMAALRLADVQTARQVLDLTARRVCEGTGGVPYASDHVHGFTDRPALAPTVWFLMLEREYRTGELAPVFLP